MRRRLPRMLAAAAAAVSVASASAATDMKDIEALLAELAQLPDEVVQADPRRWQEVLDLLQQLVQAESTDTVRRDPQRLPAALEATARFPALYRQIVAELRSGTGDLASRVFGSGLAAGAGRRAAPTMQELAAQAGLALPDKAALALGMRKVEAVNALTPNARALTEGMRENIAQLHQRSDHHAQELMKLQRVGGAMAGRLAQLDSLVQRSASLGAAESLADEADVAHLRAELAALRVAQQEAYAELGGHDPAAGLGPLQAPRAATSPRVNRSALAGELVRQAQALREQGGDPVVRAVRIGQCELYLAALDVLNGEETVKAAAMARGDVAQAHLTQVSADARRLGEVIDRGAAR